MSIKGNLWAQFKKATQGDPQQIATVSSANGTRYTVETTSGYADVQGEGEYALLSKVFIKDGQIIGQAPDLTYVEIEV